MQRAQPGIISPHWRIRRYTDFCPVSAEQLYGRQTTVREMNQLLIGMDSNALREFLNPEGADSEKLCQERATEQAYYQGGMLLNELDEDKNPARHYVLGNKYIGLAHNYYLTDEQGSVRYVLDAAGNVQNDYRYDAFGQRIAGQEDILMHTTIMFLIIYRNLTE